MTTIGDILAGKGTHINTISVHASVFSAAILMNEHKIGSLLVLEEGRLVGILTERDILLHIVAEQRDAHTTMVGDVMTRDVVCCRPHTDMDEARSVMKHRRIRHLPVMADDGTVAGVISIGDLNAYHCDYQERTIQLLQGYIHTGGW